MSQSSSDDYALARVPASARRHWFGIAVQRFGMVGALAQFLIGATLGYGMSFANAFLAILLGSLLVELIMLAVGIIGQREGLNTSLLARWTGFGDVGAALVGLAIGISLIGWFGIQSAISADSLNALLPGVMAPWLWSLIFGLIVTAIVAFGFLGMQWLANITVPLFLILVAWSVTSELSRHNLGELLSGPPPGPSLSLIAGAGIVAGGVIVGAIITPDMTRFNRSGSDVVKQTVVGVSLGEFVIGLAGVLVAHGAQSGDIVAIITSSVGLIGLIIVVSGTLKVNDWNLYSSTLGVITFVHTLFGVRLNRLWTSVIFGVIGSVLAAAGILGRFTDFLVLLGVVFPPIAGIMVAEYFIVKAFRPLLEKRGDDETALPETAPRWVPATLIIWAASALVGHFVTWGIPAVTSLLLSIVLYVIAGKLGLVRGVGVAHTSKIEVAA
ncbi:cytosine permease [Mycetocola tolaasinivorans]|uniref:Cytosine permease n=1 Tax=Mycetocola tolaasinivorans TaxID=76635 RepID=A0A3L7A5V0_9MICO|nr:cytosine permease [Mycetocola tolaasinivorans]RLP75308.1 cytosine permease [Mycetocola tolaasinivorans]